MSVTILRGDARDLPLPDESVDLIVTSPPYFGLRDYRDSGESLAGQIGSEGTPREFVDSLLSCTREWMRVLKPEGSLFINLGDSYYSGKGAPGKTTTDPKNAGRNARRTTRSPLDYGLSYPRKTLLGIPWRYALGCIDDLDLILRAEIVWSKPNGLPESVADRVRRAHEQIFHFTKQPNYYSAVDEIREAHAAASIARYSSGSDPIGARARQRRAGDSNGTPYTEPNPLGKLPGSVWEIASQPLKVPAHLGLDHFAAFPMELPRRCILGWSPPGICAACGEGRHPVVDARRTADGHPVEGTWDTQKNGHALGPQGIGHWRFATDRWLLGYACACTPYADHPERRGKDFHAGTDRARQGMNDGNGGERYRRYVEEMASPRGPVREYDFARWTPAPTRPAVVLDPFSGTGTTALVADVLGRIGIGIDRSADYCRLAEWRTTDPGERARALGVPKPPPVIEGQLDMFGGAA